LKEVNQTILRQYSAVMFVTVFLAVVDTKKQTFEYVNAGHNPPLVRRASGTIESLTNTGSVVGVIDELQLSDRKITLGPGDAVVMYTDGVIEAWHPHPRRRAPAGRCHFFGTYQGLNRTAKAPCRLT